MNVLISLIVSIIVLLGLIGIAIFGNTLPSIGLGIICFVLIICFSISYKELTSFLLKKTDQVIMKELIKISSKFKLRSINLYEGILVK